MTHEQLEALARVEYRMWAIEQIVDLKARKTPLEAMVDEATGNMDGDIRATLDMMREQRADLILLERDTTSADTFIRELEELPEKP